MLIVTSDTPFREGNAFKIYFFSFRWISENGFTTNPNSLKYWNFPLGIESFYSLSFNFGFLHSAKVFEFLVLGEFLLNLIPNHRTFCNCSTCCYRFNIARLHKYCSREN